MLAAGPSLAHCTLLVDSDGFSSEFGASQTVEPRDATTAPFRDADLVERDAPRPRDVPDAPANDAASIPDAAAPDICSEPLEAKGHRYLWCDLESTPRRTYNEARTFCASFGYHVVTIGDAEEQAVVDQLNAGRRELFLGLSDLSRARGDYAWIDGTPYTYGNWFNDQPSLADPEAHCVGFSQTGFWYVQGCGWPYRTAICESP